MNNIVIIADDLTGANDTGVQFCKYGYKTFVIVDYLNFDCNNILDYNVVSINANSRILDIKKAYERVYSIAKESQEMNFDLIYKKVDSVMRGNPGAELEGIMDAINAEIAFVAPSFPSNNRAVKDGYLYVDNNIDDKKNFVPEIFQKEMKRKVKSILLDVVREGENALVESILSNKQKGEEVFVIDALTDDDLYIIAKAAKQINKKIVLCGSAGFAQQLPQIWKFKSEDGLVSSKKDCGIILLVVGSRNFRTASQIKKVSDLFNSTIIKIDTCSILKGKSDEVIQKIVYDTGKCITDKNVELVIIAVDSLFNDDNMYVNNLKIDSQDNGDAQLIVSTIGQTVKNIYEKYKVKAMVVTGGDTSMQVCKALEVKGIQLINEIVSGIPAGKLLGGTANNLCFITKSGGFGTDNALLSVIDYLKNEKLPNE